ncbi:polysaccharide deacetylase [Gammaproteobacteria bacterium 54_18_T64]|nr:polysaccharide deacetylase [Gammaproteobacteria bacterium 54_18_T64]
MNAAPILNAMTVDVEDYYQVSAFEKHICRTTWNDFDCRVEANIERILQLFEKKSVKATFFTLGWVAERHPSMVRKIVASGHELASHGWDHRRVTSQEPASFKDDVLKTRALLEDISGQVVKGYRAASYSIGAENLWALDVLAEAGYEYSSSIVPIRHDHYGMPDAPRFAFRAAGDRILEIPVSTVTVMRRNINCGGGGWFRFFPYGFTRWALQRVNEREQRSCVFYFHPWEIDEEQPRIDNLGHKTRFRHYLNLHKTHPRLERLLDDFCWGRMDEIFLGTAQ